MIVPRFPRAEAPGIGGFGAGRRRVQALAIHDVTNTPFRTTVQSESARVAGVHESAVFERVHGR